MQLIIVTITYDRPGRMAMIGHLKSHLDKREDVRWIVVEDGAGPHPEMRAFLPPYATYMQIGPTKDLGHVQRNLALEYIQNSGLEGIIYNADDDNKYDPSLFDEIKKTKHISMFPVGNLGPHGVERPIVLNGKFARWDANWTERKFPIDMAGFAFNAKLLKELQKPLWVHRGRGGESEFICKIANSTDEVEFLCNRCTDVLVWWNELRKEAA